MGGTRQPRKVIQGFTTLATSLLHSMVDWYSQCFPFYVYHSFDASRRFAGLAHGTWFNKQGLHIAIEFPAHSGVLCTLEGSASSLMHRMGFMHRKGNGCNPAVRRSRSERLSKREDKSNTRAMTQVCYIAHDGTEHALQDLFPLLIRKLVRMPTSDDRDATLWPVKYRLVDARVLPSVAVYGFLASTTTLLPLPQCDENAGRQVLSVTITKETGFAGARREDRALSQIPRVYAERERTMERFVADEAWRTLTHSDPWKRDLEDEFSDSSANEDISDDDDEVSVTYYYLLYFVFLLLLLWY